MGFLSKIVGDVVEAVVDTTELAVKTSVDVVTLPMDLTIDDKAFERAKKKLEEIQED